MQDNDRKFQGILFKSFFKFANIGPKSYRTMQMAQRIEQMKTTMSKTTPKAFSIFFMLSTIPTFYFMNEMLNTQYKDPAFSKHSNRIYKYFYLTNTIFTACALGLSQMNFLYPSSENTLMKAPSRWRYLPLILSFIGLMIPQSDSKLLAIPAGFTLAATLLGEAILQNFGYTPFWFYSYRYYIGMFNLLAFVLNFVAMKRFAARRVSHPQEFIKQIQIISDEDQDQEYQQRK